MRSFDVTLTDIFTRHPKGWWESVITLIINKYNLDGNLKLELGRLKRIFRQDLT